MTITFLYKDVRLFYKLFLLLGRCNLRSQNHKNYFR